MKIFISALLLLAVNFHVLSQQHPLVGTWEMISIKGVNASGEKFSNDTSSIREIKIITPTHYMLMAYDVEGDSLVFNRCYTGSVKFDGPNYHEYPILSSVTIFENVKTDYNWKVDHDKFSQSGTIVRPDGNKIVLEEMLFKKHPATGGPNPAIGTWKLISSVYTTAEGTTHKDSNENLTAFHIITPTHWMYMSSRNKTFEHAMGGGYTKQSDKFLLTLDYASFPKTLWGKTETTNKVDGDTLTTKGISISQDGKKFTWEDVYERLK